MRGPRRGVRARAALLRAVLRSVALRARAAFTMEDHPGGAAQGGALAEALARCVGARIDAAHANPATGLVALAVYDGTRRVLGAGIGPRVAGAGIPPRLPRLRAGASHPLVAAMRAHLVGRRVLAIEVRSDGIVIVAGVAMRSWWKMTEGVRRSHPGWEGGAGAHPNPGWGWRRS